MKKIRFLPRTNWKKQQQGRIQSLRSVCIAFGMTFIFIIMLMSIFRFCSNPKNSSAESVAGFYIQNLKFPSSIILGIHHESLMALPHWSKNGQWWLHYYYYYLNYIHGGRPISIGKCLAYCLRLFAIPPREINEGLPMNCHLICNHRNISNMLQSVWVTLQWRVRLCVWRNFMNFCVRSMISSFTLNTDSYR